MTLISEAGMDHAYGGDTTEEVSRTKVDQLHSVLMRVTEAEEDGNVCNSVSKSLKGWRRQLAGGRSRNLLRSVWSG